MGSLRIALCQIDAVVGDLEGNARRVLDALGVAEESGCDLAVFPELVLTGYPPEDLLLKGAFLSATARVLEDLAAQTRHCAAVVGFVEAGLDLYNAAVVLADGRVHGVWHKEQLPNYGVFDEHRWFAPGTGDTPLFSIAGVRVGVTICEDAWSPTGPVGRQAAGGAELIVSLNASPYRAGVLAARERMLATRAADASCPLVYVNLVGGQDELVFDGASMVFDLEGNLVAAAPQFGESVMVLDLELPDPVRKHLLEPRGRTVSPPLPVLAVTEPVARTGAWRHPVVTPRLSPTEEVYEALVVGTRDYIDKNGFGDVVIALSGGVDSALVATIAADALGPDRVHTVSLPSRYSSAGSIDDATELAKHLGIDFQLIAIEAVHAGYLELLAPVFGDRAADLTEENLQARIRGTIIMALSNKFGWLVLTTGNKSEMAVGYATLYGDMAGGFAVIKDVPKTLVYELCEMRNARAGYDLIPRAILDKPPSAELRDDQRDEDSLPPYDVLDPILQGYVEEDRSLAELLVGRDEATVRRVIDLVDFSEYKRRQAPPGVRVTSRAFGKDRRMPITNRFRSSATGAPRPDGESPA